MTARDVQDRHRLWLLASFDGPALRQMAEDRHDPRLPVDEQPIRLPLGGDPANAWLTANAIARSIVER